ncbi:ATP-binding protein [Sinomonas sp. G460-2]|uniref:ATP-binding protein n=1 Tax=Sinomonas sp. G460-2 TaxID=3393464 RepID=UPI0039F142AE
MRGVRYFAQWWRHRPLASQILAWTSLVLLVTAVIGVVIASHVTRNVLDGQYRLRSLAVATTVAETPGIAAAVVARDPTRWIRDLADRVTDETDVTYVVVTGLDAMRLSHPNRFKIGLQLEEPLAIMDGHSHLGTQNGSLGVSANAKVPIKDDVGAIVGQVSVGILESSVEQDLADEALGIAGLFALLLAGATVGSVILAQRIKRATYGLEPGQMTSLLQNREALLHGIREGMIGLDDGGRVTVINSEARRLLGLDGTLIDKRIDELVPPGRLLEVLTDDGGGDDQVVITDDALLVANRRRVSVAGRSVGAVVTLRDRTETEALVRDLRSTQGLIEALRAQEHEYANRLHVVTGLLDAGHVEKARSFVSTISDTARSLGEGLRSRIEPPELAALVLAKATVAAEQGVALVVTESSQLKQPELPTVELLTLVGNLLDNAIDALAGTSGERTVTLHLDDSDGVFISVRDTGPGVPADLVDEVFHDGFSTKEARPGLRRGIGLALVARIVRRSGGTLDVFPGPGGRFEVWFPGPTMEAKERE